MSGNYIKTSLRNLWKNKGFSAINILGLAVGLATCLLILLFVRDELGYDRYNAKADRIYRIDGDIQFGGVRFIEAVTPDPMGPTLKQELPQVEQYVRFRSYNGRFLVKKGAEQLPENRVRYADSTLFSVFSLPMIQGDPATALVAPNSVVLTETMARKYFNKVEVVGKVLLVNDTSIYKITGVIRDMPAQSHFTDDFFVSMSSNPESRQGLWYMENFNTYVVLKAGADRHQLETRFGMMVDKYILPQVEQVLGMSKQSFTQSGNFVRFTLMPLTDIHLHSNKIMEMGPNSDITYVYVFSFAAIFILIIACINFMNLSTAKSSDRAREVGVRKVLGSSKAGLVRRFLTESMLVSIISMVLAINLVILSLPYFNELSGKDMHFQLWSSPDLILYLTGLTLAVGLLAGSYPAFYLSSFAPIKVLKGVIASGFRGAWLRSGLVVLQFSISIFLIVGTVVIYDQLQYIRHKDVGFNREQVLILQNTDAMGRQAKTFREELLHIRGVEDVTLTRYLPTNGHHNEAPMFRDASLDQKTAISLQLWNIDEHYLPTLGMKMATGRNFSEQFPTDSNGIILNETAARLLGYADPLNKKLYIPKDIQASRGPDNILAFHILGVVKDFNFNSLRQQVAPLVFFMGAEPNNTAIRVHTADIAGLVAQVGKVWKKLAPAQPFTYSFMDDDFNHIYQAEQRMGGVVLNFAGLAIFIACLGLFALVAYAAEQRSKEIGIRKVLGASVNNIVLMLSGSFLKLVLVSILIASPIAWWLMSKWLEGFSYRIHMSIWFLVISGILAVLIALITVCSQAIKAAIANPVESLRSE